MDDTPETLREFAKALRRECMCEMGAAEKIEQCADTIGALKAENDRLHACLSERDKMNLEFQKRVDDLSALNDRLRDALTPGTGTKAAYIGEFKTPLTLTRTDGSEYTVHVDVTWTTIKEIMSAIRSRAALNQEPKK